MKTLLALNLLFLVSFATTKSLSLFGGSQIPLDDGLDVPGENPLKFCASRENYSLDIKKVDLNPNPPKKGTALSIEAQGNFTEKVEEGAYVNLSVKYGLITLLSLQAQLCEQIKEVDEECPLTGSKVIKKNVDIPSSVPPGSYSVLVDAYTRDDESIICLKATVAF